MFKPHDDSQMMRQVRALPQPPPPGEKVRIPLDLLGEWLKHHKLQITGSEFRSAGHHYPASQQAKSSPGRCWADCITLMLG